MRSWLLWRSRIFNQLQSLVVHESLFHIVRDIDSLIQIWQERYLRWYMLASLIGWGGLWDEIFEERSLRERWAANVAPIVCFKRAWYVMQLAVCWSNWQLHVILLIELGGKNALRRQRCWQQSGGIECGQGTTSEKLKILQMNQPPSDCTDMTLCLESVAKTSKSKKHVATQTMALTTVPVLGTCVYIYIYRLYYHHSYHYVLCIWYPHSFCHILRKSRWLDRHKSFIDLFPTLKKVSNRENRIRFATQSSFAASK